MKKKFLLVLCMLLALMIGCTEAETPDDTKKNDVVEEKEDEEKEPEKEPEVQKVKVLIFHPDEEYMELVSDEVELEKVDENILWAELLKVGMIKEDCKINSFKQEGKYLELDVNQAFGEYIRTMGTSGETMTLGSIVNTFLTQYQADEIKITEEGDVLWSGHAEYDQSFTFFD